METVNIHEAKTHLSKLLERVRRGEPFIIAKAGVPIAKVIAADAPAPDAARRLGFPAGEVQVPDDFNRRDADRVAALFAGDDAAVA